ncbi:hypothetical protein R5R35_009855 [Gryllus longicercus]|uniref:Uncharacterized protein n=1 Tax=Gryllus longicercus TaxID=2509291 RepID=A0AAN9ZDW7_9ORTH
MQCEAVLLGREAVEGAVDAAAMASLIRGLLQSRERIARSAGDLYRDRRRYLLRCRDGLEIVPSPKPSPASSASPSPTTASSSASSTASSTRPRRADDEGFESDDDTASTKSAASLDDTVSNSSSCCFVDDHVFKFGPGAVAARGVVASTSSNSSVATDSANSSGASDTDDVDSSGAPSPSAGAVAKLVKSLTLYQRGGPAPGAAADAPHPQPTPARPEGEVYPVADVAFCHLDPAFPKVVVWVVKRKRPQRLSATPDGSATGLQAIVFECVNERALKKFCANYQEMSRRAKLDQYKHPHRRKDVTPAFATLYRGYLPSVSREKPSLDSQIQPLDNPKTIKLELELSKTTYDSKTLSNVGSRAQKAPPKTLPKPTSAPAAVKEDELPVAAKFNLVQRTDGDGVTHIEVARGASDAATPPAPRVETIPETSTGPSSIISISTPDVGNLLTTGPTSGAARASRLGKEIEGVIRSDVDAASRREPPRQRQPAILVMNPEDAASELHKVWNPPEAVAVAEEDDEDQKDVVTADPPQRPERRKYVRKKNPAPQPPVQQSQPPRSAPSPDPYQKKPLVPYKPDSLSRGQKIVRGQFIRVSVDQPVAPVQQPWIFGSTFTNGWDSPRDHLSRRGLDDMFAVQGHSLRQHPHKGLQHRRSRSTGGAGRSRSKSPPLARRPMAYRYIDVANPPPPQPPPASAGRFFGLSQKLKELGGGGGHPSYATTARRRGSAGEATHLAAAAAGGQACHLKSVIKKSKRAGEYVEPKKVTFSAYATVQVVD